MRRSTLFLVLVTLLLVSVGCRNPVDAGEPCFDSDECEGGAVCAATESALGSGGTGGSGGTAGAGGQAEADKFCMLECSEDVILCENDGEACVRSDEESLYVCLPGGDQDVGAVCLTSFDCQRGSVCVMFSVGSICRPLCDPAQGDQCDLGLGCIAFDDDESRGYCEVPVVNPLN
jgi:hypothetical protein